MGAAKCVRRDLFSPLCEMMMRWLMVQLPEILGYANLVMLQIFQLYTIII